MCACACACACVQTACHNAARGSSRQELKAAFRAAGRSCSDGEIKKMMDQLDTNGDGVIDMGEFKVLVGMAATMAQPRGTGGAAA